MKKDLSRFRKGGFVTQGDLLERRHPMRLLPPWHWFDRGGRPFAHSRRRAARPERRHSRPRLEALEDRSVPSTVSNLFDSGPGSLRQAIVDTPAAGTVDFQPGLSGTITLAGSELAISKDLTIAGPGANVITVSGNNASRVFDITGAVTVGISGLTIANGRVTAPPGSSVSGGGVFNTGTLALMDCVLSGNTATGSNFTSSGSGGGVYNTGTLALTDCVLSGNSAAGPGASGGGVDNAGTLALIGSTVSGNTTIPNNLSGGVSGGGIENSGALTLTNSTVSGNVAIGGGASNSTGGGIDNTGYLVVTGSTISGNDIPTNGRGSGLGGGIYNGGASAVLLVTSSSITGNTAGAGDHDTRRGAGGGIYNSGGTVAVTNSTVSGNAAIDTDVIAFGGGGIYNAGTLAVTNSTVSGNTASLLLGLASGGGGGIYNAGTLSLSSSTLSGNSASGNALGGGILNGSAGVVSLRNTILAGNTAPSGADVDGSLGSQGHNLIGIGDGGSGFADSDLVGTAQNPIDPMLGPLGYYGGPTQTMPLLLGSPAIGAGDTTNAPEFDQRGPGFARVVNGAIDIGAFEVQPAPSVASVVVNDGSAQRSMVTSLTVTFNGVVTLDPGAIEVRRHGHGHGLVPLVVQTSVVGSQTVAVITFTGSDIIGGSLPDGHYTLTVRADKVHDPSGQSLNADQVSHFFRLFGDSNGNGVIDWQDLARFASTFGKSQGDPGYLAYFDYNGDGRVDLDDLAQLLLRLGKRE
jgi:hypothetical protein